MAKTLSKSISPGKEKSKVQSPKASKPIQNNSKNDDEKAKDNVLSKKIPMVKPSQLNLAVETLIKHSNHSIKSKVDDGELFADDIDSNDCSIHLVISLKRIISREKHKPIRLDLDHPLLDPRISNVCLIVKDPQREYKDLLEEKSIKFISKVVGITKLRGKHSSFEARRLLLNSFGLFLADDRILPILPNILGTKFFKSKKLPVPVDVTDHSQLKAKLEKAISSTYMRLGAGSCLTIKVADLSRHGEDEIKENLIKVLEQLGKKLPMGGWSNIQGVHIKTGTSTSLPIWLAELNEGEFGRFDLTPTKVEQDGKKEAEEKKRKISEIIKEKKANKRKRSASEPTKPTNGTKKASTGKEKADSDKSKTKKKGAEPKISGPKSEKNLEKKDSHKKLKTSHSNSNSSSPESNIKAISNKKENDDKKVEEVSVLKESEDESTDMKKDDKSKKMKKIENESENLKDMKTRGKDSDENNDSKSDKKKKKKKTEKDEPKNLEEKEESATSQDRKDDSKLKKNKKDKANQAEEVKTSTVSEEDKKSKKRKKTDEEDKEENGERNDLDEKVTKKEKKKKEKKEKDIKNDEIEKVEEGEGEESSKKDEKKKKKGKKSKSEN